MRNRTKNGFSIIEVLIAIGVVSVGILALLAVFITGTRSNQHGDDMSRAVFYARKLTETIRANGLAFNLGSVPPPNSSGLNDNPGQFRALNAVTTPPVAEISSIRLPKLDANGVPEDDGSGGVVLEPADDKFERNIQMQRASSTTTDYNYDIVRLSVTIRWVGGRTGDGMRRIKVDSLLKRASS